MPTRLRGRRRTALVAASSVVGRIHLVRGLRVMFDSDLADLYGVPTRALNQAVSRNAARFPADFAFRLTRLEAANLKSQIVTSSSHGGSRKLPRVFTEQGVAMLSSVLHSRRAVEVNVAIMRAFVLVRELSAASAGLALRIDELEQRYDGQFADVFDAIRELVAPSAPEPPRRRIGFTIDVSPASVGRSGRGGRGRRTRRTGPSAR